MSIPALNWKIAGAAGEGVKSTGLMFSKTCLRHGLFTFDYTEYPSLIRGGHNTYQVKAGMQKVHSQEKPLDILVALNQNGPKEHKDELHDKSVFIYDSADDNYDASEFNLPGQILDIPMTKLAKDVGAERVMKNNVALGASMFLLGLQMDILDTVIEDTFGSKGQEVVTLNQKSAQAGYNYAKTNFKPLDHISVQKQDQVDSISLTGNEAASLGAIAGGLKAYIAYPMTPSSSILHILAGWSEAADVMVKHAEDEIGVINMALGASFAGVRTAVGTSGGGFAYMTEALGMSGVAELPIVIIESQRPGPALGMPTWTAQADLLFVIRASQDEFPRIVLAPGDVKEAFDYSKLSFELAEKYQLPVILLLDKHLSESGQSTHFDTTTFSHQQVSINQNPQVNETGFYSRYAVTENGITLRTIPGQKDGYHVANSYEHDDQGLAAEDSKTRIDQMNKRFRKLDNVFEDMPEQFYDGSDNPQITFITWGSTKTAVQAGIEQLREQGIDAAAFNLAWMYPFPTDLVKNVIERSQNPVLVEGNKTYQFGQLIRAHTGIDIYHKRSKFDGRPFYPGEIVKIAQEILNP